MRLGISEVKGDPRLFTFPVEMRWCSGTDMFGGTTFGAVIDALEISASVPLISASAQFIQTAQFGGVLEIETNTFAVGKLTTQMQGLACQEARNVCGVTAALGQFSPSVKELKAIPSVLTPENSLPRSYKRPIPGSFAYTLDVRTAEVGPNSCRVWARWPDAVNRPMSASVLAILADHPSFGIGLIRGDEWYGLSLDSTLRIATTLSELNADSWVLIDMQFSSIGERFAHCSANLWSQSGRLIALAAQTMRLRQWQHAPENRQNALVGGQL